MTQLFRLLYSVSSCSFVEALIRARHIIPFLSGIEEFQGVFARNSEWLLDALSSDSFAALVDTRRVDHFRRWVEHDANEIISGFTASCIALQTISKSVK